MAYTVIDFKTKKAMKKAFIAWRDQAPPGSKALQVYQPGIIRVVVKDGDISIEGPHYPKPHTWYARVRIEGGIIAKVIS